MNEPIFNQKKPLTEERFAANDVLRERYIEHTEVLDKVKPLFLIPYMECMTTMQLADYYEVSEKDIMSCYKYWKSEFTSDGARKYTFAEVISIVESQDSTSSLVKRCRGRAEIHFAENKIAYIASHGVYMFPKRAVLRMGMLLTNLTENNIAKKVRTQLVNIDIPAVDTTSESKTTETKNSVDYIMYNTKVQEVQIENEDNTKYICIHGTNIIPKMYNGQRVVTFKDIDMIHHRADGTASRNFRENRSHFIEGEDYFIINQPDEIRRLGFSRPQGGIPESVILLTESGYLMTVKSLRDDLAWQVQRELVKSYFRVKQIEKVVTEIVETVDDEQQLLNNIVQAYLSGNAASVMAAASVHAKFLKCQNEQLAERNAALEEDRKLLIADNTDLENDKRILTADNALLAEKVLTWTDRDTFVKLIKSAAYVLHKKEAFLYTDIYKELRCKHHIDLKKRQQLDTEHKNKPLISYMRDYEWKYLYSTLAALLQTAGINPILVFKQAKAEDKLNKI